MPKATRKPSFARVPPLRFCVICCGPILFQHRRGRTTNPTCGKACWEEKRNREAAAAGKVRETTERKCLRCETVFVQVELDRKQTHYCSETCAKEAGAEASREASERNGVLREIAAARATLPPEVVAHGRLPRRTSR